VRTADVLADPYQTRILWFNSESPKPPPNIDSSCATSSPAGPARASNLANTLAQNHDVVIIDNLATGRRVNIEHLLDHPWVTFIEGSITDLDLLMDTFPGADGIFHQAAIASVPRSVKDPLASNEANVTGTLDVLVAAKDCGVPAIAY
jgi:nucleoside-diphosphate-sugar epimerase